MQLSYDLAITLLARCPEYIPKKLCNRLFVTALFVIAKDWKLPKW